jgi:hypothetical protein
MVMVKMVKIDQHCVLVSVQLGKTGCICT